ncbi:hypothetical protein AURDEDRAFT_164619 [Auricularia subglabra TFB-10046 SS5]|nr:hypothetical protein AURDEDRAFT_164619 [Auricularia subglabra TFB-10046 SS5]
MHIGYSIERTCEKRPPVVERDPVAYVLGNWQERLDIWEGVGRTGPPANLTEDLAGLTLPENFGFVACVDMYAEDPKRAPPDEIENICGDENRMLAQDVPLREEAGGVAALGWRRATLGLSNPI